MSDLIKTHIAGVKFREGARDYLDRLPPGAPLALEPEEGNDYDPNAVKVLHDGFHVGYVPAFLCAKVKGLLAEGRVEFASYDGDKGMVITYREAAT